MTDSIINEVWKDIMSIYGDRKDCIEAIEAYNNGYASPEKLLPKAILNYFYKETGDAGRNIRLQEKRGMINRAQKWGELNNFAIDAEPEEDGTYTYFLHVYDGRLTFEITEDSVRHCADEYECYLEDGILKPISQKY